MIPREPLHRLGDVRTTIMRMMITLVTVMMIMEMMMIVMMMMITLVVVMTNTATRIVTLMRRMVTHAKLAEIVVATPGAKDKPVSAFVEARPTDVFPNAAEYLARHGGRADVMVRRDDAHN